MNRILLVGAGNLGSRHLQSIAQLELPVKVVVVEPRQQAREIAYSRWQEIHSSALHSLSFEDINDVEPGFDFAIVATLSIDRLSMIERVLELNVRNILSEKVIFQSVQLYREALDLLSNSKSQIYINYIYRLSEVFQKMRQEFEKQVVDLDVNAGSVELGCNLVHYLDLCQFLNHGAEITNLEVDISESQNNNARHKRLMSFYGVATAKYSNGAILRVRLMNEENTDYTLKVAAHKQHYVVNETHGKVCFDGRTLYDFVAPRVSETTVDVIRRLQQNQCVLPTLMESSKVNEVMLNEINKCHHGESDHSLLCPIT